MVSKNRAQTIYNSGTSAKQKAVTNSAGSRNIQAYYQTLLNYSEK